MCGSGKKRLQEKAEGRAQQTTGLEHERAQDMQNRLAERRGGIDIPGQRDTARNAAVGQLETGGFDPERMRIPRETAERLAGDVGFSGSGREIAQRLGEDVGFSGSGREGYEEFATTGGFSPGEREQFLRRGTAPTAAIYARSKDELNRRLATQGGYSPGFTTSQARLTRGAAQAGAEASLGANVDLAEQVRKGKELGLGGLERTRIAAGKEQLEAARHLGDTRIAAGKEQLEAARALGNFERDIASGRREALDNVVRILGMSIDEMQGLDQTELANRALAAGMSQQEVNALISISGQKRGAFDYAAPFIGAAGAIGGAYAGRPR